MKPAISKEERYKGKTTMLTYKARQSLLSQAYYCIIKLGFTQKRTSIQLGVSTRTMCKWVKKYGWDKKIQAIKEGGETDPVKYDESLSAFIAYVRIKKPTVYNTIKQVHKQFLNSL